MDEITRIANNFATLPTFECTLSKSEVKQLLDTYDTWLFCRGEIRDFVVTKVFDDRYSVSTKER